MSEFIVVTLAAGVFFCVVVFGFLEFIDWVAGKIKEGVG